MGDRGFMYDDIIDKIREGNRRLRESREGMWGTV